MPDRDSGKWLGYELGKEKFQRPDGKEVVDDCKASYYAMVPEHSDNVWPKEVNLQTPFQVIGSLMDKTGRQVMEKIGLTGDKAALALDTHQVGRMLYYRPTENPMWCGPHHDHGVFTTLLPAVYFTPDGKQVAEPEEAGLFVKSANDADFRKVVSDDPEVMLFQVGEFGQLATNDKIRATEHRVHGSNTLERYTMALFFAAPFNSVHNSASVLTKDARWGSGESCRYGDWHIRSMERYRAK